jgi:hypothetical protein
MTETSIRVFIVNLPQDKPELAPHFAALASENGWQRHFRATDKETGEKLIVQFRAPEDEAASMAQITVQPSADCTAFQTVMGEVLALVEAADRPVEVRHAFADRVIDLFKEGRAAHFNNLPASAAGELTVGLAPSDELRGLVAAFRAGNSDLQVVHDSSLHGGGA